MPRIARVACICLLILPCLPGISSADGPAPALDRQAVLTRQRDHYLQTVRILLPLTAHRMDQIMRLEMRGGQLTLTTPLKPQDDFEGRRAEIEGLAAPAVVTYVQFPNNPSARQFELKFEEYPDADTYGQFHLQWQPALVGQVDELSMERSVQTSHGFLRVFYYQGATMARVLVFENDAATDRNMESFNITEKDFATFRKLHPDEIERYVRPLLHRLGQDRVFSPDVNTAWQVLAADWPVDDQTRRQVMQALPALDDPRSSVRNEATVRLVDLGRDAASAILKLDRTTLSREQNLRLDEVLSRFRRMSDAAARRLEADPDFLLDCAYNDDLTVRKLSAARLARVVGHPIELDPDAPEYARAEAADRVRRQLHPTAATRP